MRIVSIIGSLTPLRSLTIAALALVLAFAPTAGAGVEGEQVVDWLPDMFFEPADMSDQEIDTTTLPGQWLFRFRTSIPNVGLGEFRLEATGVDIGNGRQDVNQRIQRSDGTSFLRDAGGFLYNPETGRMEVIGWADYRIRELLPCDAVGEVVATGAKTAVRITSSTIYDDSIPNVPDPGDRIFAVGGTHGISVGYTDIYTKTLENQWVDFTGVPGGEYWLEVEVDGGNHLLESDETNNITRIKITLPDQDAEGEAEGDGEGGEPVSCIHSADQNGDNDINLSELLRVIQFYNSDGFSCAIPPESTEDGYQPDSGNQSCTPHAADYNPQDWALSLSEILRIIQFFNTDGYYACLDDTEDGYCVGAPPGR